jgi:hypothetical protein
VHPINSGESWHVRATSVREHNGGALRWTVDAWRNDEVVTITCDTTPAGGVMDLQSEYYAGTTGDATLDVEVREHIADIIAMRDVLRQLPRVETTLHRSDRLRVA